MFELAVELIASIRTGLSIWDNHERTKYIDLLNEIEEKLYEYRNTPEENQDNRVFDNLMFRLFITRRGFSATVGEKKSNG